jgi:hypothetical protein
VHQRRGLILARLMCCFAVGLHALSFFLPTFAIVVDGNVDVSPGWAAFLVGGYRVFLPWLANPIFVVALVQSVRGRFKASAILGGCALVASESFFLFAQPGRWDLVFSGFYTWLLSMVILAVAAGIGWAMSD